MPVPLLRRVLSCLTVALITAACSQQGGRSAGGSSYEDLVAFFEEWREFQHPLVVDGVPDYTAQAMGEQRIALAAIRDRLAAFDTTGWSVAQQIDYHLVRAELNGLDFDHRVLRPWARNPAFYVMIFTEQSDVPAHEGPVVYGWIDLWTYDYPLSDEAAADLTARVRVIPPLLEQARENLVGNARDLWMGGIRSMTAQIEDLHALHERVAGSHPQLDAAIELAIDATDGFRVWLEEEAPSKTGRSGVGIEDYSWYLKHVHLVPYTWEEVVTLMRRELARAHSALRLEEHRNRRLPPLARIGNAAQFDRQLNAAVTEYMAFLRDNEIMTVTDTMEPALRERIGEFRPAEGLRGFFDEVAYRDPLTMRTHGHHWFDLAEMAKHPHPSPIRRVPLLYNIWDSRAEGAATGMEEWMMHAGLFDDRPRSRELIYILIAQRAARALGGLLQHSNELSWEEAARYASERTPRGWLPADGATIIGEQHLYLQQPFYGDSYLMGKSQIEQLMAERANQLGEEFNLKRFMDEMHASGLIPVSLIRWELTGQTDEIMRLTSPD